jgi:hypothetical protein
MGIVREDILPTNPIRHVGVRAGRARGERFHWQRVLRRPRSRIPFRIGAVPSTPDAGTVSRVFSPGRCTRPGGARRIVHRRYVT